jgi:hypothetical protein
MRNSKKAGYRQLKEKPQLCQAAASSLAPALQPCSIMYGEQMQVQRMRSIVYGECAEKRESVAQSKDKVM